MDGPHDAVGLPQLQEGHPPGEHLPQDDAPAVHVALLTVAVGCCAKQYFTRRVFFFFLLLLLLLLFFLFIFFYYYYFFFFFLSEGYFNSIFCPNESFFFWMTSDMINILLLPLVY